MNCHNAEELHCHVLFIAIFYSKMTARVDHNFPNRHDRQKCIARRNVDFLREGYYNMLNNITLFKMLFNIKKKIVFSCRTQ